MPIALGSVIGDYEVIGTLGAGGIGQVYRVRHTISHRVEAMKVLLSERIAGTDTTDRFLREIRLLASLSHPNIASLHTAFRHDGELVMVMEFVEGETLRTRLRQTPLTADRSIDYVRQMLSGLAYAHEHGVVHRDVKPSNVMIDPCDRIKLLDFGLAMNENADERTRTGLVMGSPHYMSPEQVTGDRADARSDVYSVGVTLYLLLGGRPPIDGANDFAIASGHLRDTPTPLHEINTAVPRELSDIVMQALEKKPVDRFQSAQQFYDALGNFSADATRTILPTVTFSNELGARQRRADVTPTPVSRTSLTGSGILVDVSRELAQYIGPIARVVVNRAAAQVATLEELYTVVSREIESDKDRKAFLQTRSRLTGERSQV